MDGISPQLVLVILVLFFISLACNLPVMAKQAGPPQEPGRIETSIAGTMAARDQGESPDAGDQGAAGADDGPTETFTPEVSDTPTLTPTITETPTPEVAMVYASSNTNCRTGPGTSFAWLFTLQQGEEAEAVARGPAGEYWYIKQPDFPTTICALWGKYATPSGPYEALPVWTPIPTPTQGLNYTVAYHSNIGNCGTIWTLQYRIDNVGGFTLESWRTMSTDHTGGSVPLENIQNKFYDVTGCSWSPGAQEDLTPGEAYYLNAGFDNNPVGHDITVKIKICTEQNLGGQCLVKNFRHTP